MEIEFPPAVRKEHPDFPATFEARAIHYCQKGFRPRTLLTSLTDTVAYPAAEIAALYHERWELELGYDELKTHTLEPEESIRSETPEQVRQELWGMVIAYNLVRREIALLARERKLPPTRISFKTTLVLIRDLFMWAAIASPGSLPKMIKKLRLDMSQLILPPRRSERRYARGVKIKMSIYERNNKHSID
ncbi:MAG: transposase [Elusimicrobia bacterium]|nr:transposase [Elusimicrobiota bacterium]